MITEMRMKLHLLRENGYFPKAIFVNLNGLKNIEDHDFNLKRDIKNLQQINLDENSKQEIFNNLPVYLIPGLKNDFLIGI